MTFHGFKAIIDETKEEECAICSMGSSETIPNYIVYYRYKDHTTDPEIPEDEIHKEILKECTICKTGLHTIDAYKLEHLRRIK